ncbi:MAG: thioesterase [Desulfobacteraceae bacterium IS3]|nr:MAG: thioesterase [Desulfobacteraceae bacterium IS3]
MARVKLNLPEHFEFSTEIPVRISDINYGGHLGNDAVLSLIHEARLRFFKKYGFTELDIAGVGLVLTDAVIVYKSEGFHGDILQIEVTRDDFNKYGCDFFYRLTNKDTGNEIAVAKTGIVFFDREKKKVAEVPEKFRNLELPSL